MDNKKHLTIKAPAKINLYLEVTGRRADGYHDLRTFMQKLELADILNITQKSEGEGVSMVSNDEDLPTDKRNLAVRAAHVFMAETGLSLSVAISLDKKIPVAAGLGGGSSDAAAVLTALNQMNGLPLDQKRLRAAALSIGADVPFLASDYAAAWATGVGERLQAAPSLANYWIVLVNPGFAVSTKWVFESYGALLAEETKTRNVPEASTQRQTDNLALTTKGNPYILGRENERNDKIDQGNFVDEPPLYNDLEKITVTRYPELGEIKNRLLADGASGALMSGSGPTVFGLFVDKQQARVSYTFFADKYRGVFLTKPQQAGQ